MPTQHSNAVQHFSQKQIDIKTLHPLYNLIKNGSTTYHIIDLLLFTHHIFYEYIFKSFVETVLE
ncbi:hypothetical protein D3C76_918940 [compost metagenome]